MKQNKKQGFTLIELLVVIAVIGILAAILVPAVTKVIEDAKWTEMKSNGKNIYTSVFADAVDNGPIGFPDSGDYTTARKYFETIAGQAIPPGGTVASTILASGPDYYAGPNVDAAADWAQFGGNGKYCAWNVIAGGDETTDAGSPFLLSRNLTALPAAWNTSTTITLATTGDDKMDKKGERVCVAFHGAGAEVFKASKTKTIALNQPNSTIAAADFLKP